MWNVHQEDDGGRKEGIDRRSDRGDGNGMQHNWKRAVDLKKG